MDTIHRLKISKMFPEDVYQKGKHFFERDQVSDLLYDMNYRLWTANVHADNIHFVEINVKELSEGVLKAYCDCPAFATYDSCEHIVAVLLHVQNRAIPEPENNYEQTAEFIQNVMMNEYVESDPFTEKSLLKVEYYCTWNYERELYIEIRIGESRTLMVRNIYDFLQNVLHEREHYFTKTFTYDPDIHKFSQKDLRIFELFYSMIEHERVYHENQMLDYERSRVAKHTVMIPYYYAQSLLQLLVERSFFVDAQDYLYENISLEKEQLPFLFTLHEVSDDSLEIELHGVSHGMFFPNYELLFVDGTFYILTKEQLSLIGEIDKVGLKTFQLPISKEQRQAFLSEVLPAFKRLGSVEVAKSIQENIIQLPLRAELYLDIKGDLLVGDLRYQYGKYTLDPFINQEHSDVVIIRDTEKEQRIMNIIEAADFHYNGEDLYVELENEDHLYDFLYTYLPMFEEHVQLYLTDDVRSFFIEGEATPQTSVQLASSTNLLEINFDLSGINEEEIPEILQAIIEKRRYYRMESGAFLSLEDEEFSSVEQLLTNLAVTEEDIEQGVITLPAYRAAQVDELMHIRKNYDESFKKLLERLRQPEKQIYALPDPLQASLRNYQKIGYQWFKSLSEYHFGGILADDMGLGKTLQSIAYMLSEPSDVPHLIIVPSSVLYNWKNELSRFAPTLSVAIIHGDPEERKEMIETDTKKDVWITSYATLRQDIKHYHSLTFQTMILDEAQYIKNHATKTHQAVRQIKVSRRFALSGTPIENSIDELWSIFQVIMPGLLPGLREFKQWDYERIANVTKPFILRRVKEEVLTELPEKIESVHVSELTIEQKELYLAYLHDLQQETSAHLSAGSFQEHRMKILAGLTRLRQICCHPSTFIENYEGGSGKLTQLLETVETSIANGQRMLIFSQFTSMHEIIMKHFQIMGIDYFYLHGQTPSEERVKMSEQFNNGEKDVFLISLRAGGTGLNLTGADTVILYDLWWNPAVEDQATGRAHRFGQKNVVQVIRLITEGTIEEKIYQLQQQKRELIDQVIQPGETMLSSLTEEDIRELLSL
ncbi:MAG TPA: DEAD/DEAH box helicase [Bacillota bacterium]|nr:DEAD/DEAH box helicase [Bacillota bacterium]